MAQLKKMTRAEKVLLDKIDKGQMPGVADNSTVDKLLGRGLVTFNRAAAKSERYALTKIGRLMKKRKGNDDV